MWKTRKARINTSDRLKDNDLLSQIFLTYYSLFIIIITIIDIQDDNLNFEVLTLVLSILILVVATFMFSMDFKGRYLRLQSSYIKIYKIYRETLKKEENDEDTSEQEKRYHDILECTENHNTCDYMQVMYEVRNNEEYKKVNPPFTFLSWTSFLFCKIKKIFYIVVFFSIPFAILYIV